MNHIDPAIQNIINHYKGNIVVSKIIPSKFEFLSPDEDIEEIDSDKGRYFIVSIDFIKNFAYVRNLLKENIGNYSNFVEVINPKVHFEDCYQSKFYSKDGFPKDFNDFKQFLYSRDGSTYFYFLVRT